VKIKKRLMAQKASRPTTETLELQTEMYYWRRMRQESELAEMITSSHTRKNEMKEVPLGSRERDGTQPRTRYSQCTTTASTAATLSLSLYQTNNNKNGNNNNKLVFTNKNKQICLTILCCV
jgi:hypothetical protein